MTSEVIDCRLRASEIPQMVDVDGHIDENLLRYGEGVYVRPLFDLLPADEFEWSAPRDQYTWSASEQWCPRPPSSLDDWERDLYDLPRIVASPSWLACRCPLCTGGGQALFPTVSLTLDPSPFLEMTRSISRAMDRLTETFFRQFDEASLLGSWTEPQPPKQPATCPDLTPSGDMTDGISEWAVAPVLTITPDRFTPVAPDLGAPTQRAERRAYWDRPRPRRVR